MLHTDPVTAAIPSDFTRLYRRPTEGDPEVDVVAFHWGGLTAGSWKTAFWVLLAPFMLANVAGWMLPARNRASASWVRLLGLALTALVVAQLMVAAVSLPFQWIVGADTLVSQLPFAELDIQKAALTGLSVVAALLVYQLVLVSARSHFEDFGGKQRHSLLLGPTVDSMDSLPGSFNMEPDRPADPSMGELGDLTNWKPHPITNRLRRLHLGVGVCIVGIGIGGVAGSRETRTLGSALLLILVALTAVQTAKAPKVSLRLTALAPHASLVFLCIAIGAIWTQKDPDWGLHWITEAVTSVVIAIGFGLWALMIVDMYSVGTDERDGNWMLRSWLPMSVILAAVYIGWMLTSSVGVVLGEIIGVPSIGRAEVFVSLLFLGWLAVILIFCVVAIEVPTATEGSLPSDGFALALTRRIVLRTRTLLVVTGLLVLASSYLATLAMFNQASFDLGEEQMMALYSVFGFCFAWIVWRVRGAAAATAATLALVVGFLLARTGVLDFEVLGVSFSLANPVDVAVALAIVIPGAVVLRSIWSGIRGGVKSRRKVGIIWDIGSFWPRFYHPLAPPAYGPRVLRDLSETIAEERPDIISGHSQGSFISLLALSRVRSKDLPKGFITCGSQLGLLYPSLFPKVGFHELISCVDQRLSENWVNLWRNTDYVGGQTIDPLGDRNREVIEGLGHSKYETTDVYAQVRTELCQRPTAP